MTFRSRHPVCLFLSIESSSFFFHIFVPLLLPLLTFSQFDPPSSPMYNLFGGFLLHAFYPVDTPLTSFSTSFSRRTSLVRFFLYFFLLSIFNPELFICHFFSLLFVVFTLFNTPPLASLLKIPSFRTFMIDLFVFDF